MLKDDLKKYKQLIFLAVASVAIVLYVIPIDGGGDTHAQQSEYEKLISQIPFDELPEKTKENIKKVLDKIAQRYTDANEREKKVQENHDNNPRANTVGNDDLEDVWTESQSLMSVYDEYSERSGSGDKDDSDYSDS